MIIPVLATVFALLSSPSAPQRTERLVALARLDAAVRYFDPAVATRASSWDSLFAANAVRIADAPSSAEYGRLVAAMMSALHNDAPSTTSPQRRLSYSGFPSPVMQGSGGYLINWRDAKGNETYRVDMGESVHADVRMSTTTDDSSPTAKPVAYPTAPEWRAPYPSTGYRILAAARLWNTIQLFYPYKALMKESWDDQLRVALPAVEQARTALEFAQAIAVQASHIHDSHVNVGSVALGTFTGAAPIGAGARLVENQLVITRFVSATAEAAGLRIGDIVESVDSEPTADRIARVSPFFVSSTPQALRNRLQGTLLSGGEGTTALLVVRGVDGQRRTVGVPRSTQYSQSLAKQRTGNIIRMLPGNIGYIDLDRLPVTMVDSAFRVLANTKAIVLDDRGYPLGTAWAIAPRLNTHGDNTAAAKFKRLVVPSPDTSQTTTYEFDQPIPPAQGVAKYTGRTVMLVDERTISQAEHTGLFFESANGTTFVGSPTMGANGDVTVFVIPGGISISFTGHDVRHADGSQLQRVGLQPQLAVTPTIAGIRAGRDEVLEAAFHLVGGTGDVPVDVAPVVTTTALPAEPTIPSWGAFGGVGYRAGRDDNIAHSGTSSGHITARSAAPEGFSSVSQIVRADDYRGKRVRFSAWIKTKDAMHAALWMRVDGNGGMQAFDNMDNRGIGGTADWRRVSIVLDVPNDAAGIALGMLLSSAGEAWIDDATLEIVGNDVPSTNTGQVSADPAKVEQQRAMYANAALTLLNAGFERPQ